MKFGKLLVRAVSLALPTWSDKWVDYKLLKSLLYSIVEGAAPPSDGAAPPESSAAVAAALLSNPKEVAFFRELQNQLRKVSLHYCESEAQLLERYNTVMTQFQAFCVDSAISNAAEQASSSAGSSGAAAVAAAPSSPPREAGSALLRSIVKLYMEAIQLENYAVLNYAGLGKILKKHDKVTKLPTKTQYMQVHVNVQPFAYYPRLLRLMRCIEDAYSMLVRMQPEEAASSVSHEDAQALTALQEVKTVSGLQRAAEEGVSGSGGAWSAGGDATLQPAWLSAASAASSAGSGASSASLAAAAAAATVSAASSAGSMAPPSSVPAVAGRKRNLAEMLSSSVSAPAAAASGAGSNGDGSLQRTVAPALRPSR